MTTVFRQSLHWFLGVFMPLLLSSCSPHIETKDLTTETAPSPASAMACFLYQVVESGKTFIVIKGYENELNRVVLNESELTAFINSSEEKILLFNNPSMQLWDQVRKHAKKNPKTLFIYANVKNISVDNFIPVSIFFRVDTNKSEAFYYNNMYLGEDLSQSVIKMLKELKATKSKIFFTPYPTTPCGSPGGFFDMIPNSAREEAMAFFNSSKISHYLLLMEDYSNENCCSLLPL